MVTTSQYVRHLGPRTWQKDDAAGPVPEARSGEMIGALVSDVRARRPLPDGSSGEQTLAVLVGARALVARGWLQGGWYVLEAPDGRRRFVGAVVESARWHTAEKGAAGPAIDRLWHELGGLTGHRPPADPWPPTPVLRTRQVGALATWNDNPARTREDVL